MITKFRKMLVSFFLASLSTVAVAEKGQVEWQSLNKQSTEKEKGYEMRAVTAFFGDGRIMAPCASLEAPLPEPFTMFFTVLPNGELGEVAIFPLTSTAACMKNGLLTTKFPMPKEPFVVAIGMSFKP